MMRSTRAASAIERQIAQGSQLATSVAPFNDSVFNCLQAARTAAASAWALGSWSASAVLTPVASTAPSLTTSAPNGSAPAAAFSRASRTAMRASCSSVDASGIPDHRIATTPSLGARYQAPSVSDTFGVRHPMSDDQCRIVACVGEVRVNARTHIRGAPDQQRRDQAADRCAYGGDLQRGVVAGVQVVGDRAVSGDAGETG